MEQITCPKCGEQVSLKKTCENCGATLTELVEAAKKEEKKRQREQEKKASRKRGAVIFAAVIVAAAAITAKIVYEKVKPDIWTPVQSGTEITGIWQGRTVMDISKVPKLYDLFNADNIKLPATNIVWDITLDNSRDPEQIHTVIKQDFTQYFENMKSYIAENHLPEELYKSFSLDNSVEETDGYGSISEINQMGQVFISHRKTKLKWQLNFFEQWGISHIILEKTGDTKTYKLGDFGEAGIVFYDKGSYSDGWRYLEVSLEFIRDTSWSNGSGFIKGLQTAIGAGDFNTRNIIEFLGEDTAAYAAASYRGGGKNDWYLGNIKEMQLCFKVLKGGMAKRRAKKQSDFEKFDRGIWGDAPSYIWTSEQKSATEAYRIELTQFLWDRGGSTTDAQVLPHKTLFGLTADAKDPIRPIRKF
jgi:hypothetical protein